MKNGSSLPITQAVGVGANYDPPTQQPRKPNFEKMKKASGDVIILTLCNKKNDKMMYAYSDIECNRRFFVILGHFCSFIPLLTPKIKI